MRFARTIGPQPVSIWRWTQKILRPDAGSNAPYFFYGVRPEVWGATTIRAPRTSGATTRTISLPPRPFRPDTTCPMKRRLKPPLRCASSLPPNKSDGRRRRHVEKAAHGVPEQMMIDRNRHRMLGVRQDDQLLVAMRKLPVKIDRIFHRCDAVIFAACANTFIIEYSPWPGVSRSKSATSPRSRAQGKEPAATIRPLLARRAVYGIYRGERRPF